MHRIDGPGATVDNKFTEGDPVSAVPATVVSDDWLNAVQEEIVAVILSAGLTLSKANNAQLLAAITQKITNAIPASPPDASFTVKGIVELATTAEAQAGVDAGRVVTPASLASVTSSATRAGLVELATDAETQTGTDTARAITPANLSARTATETRTGVVALASSAELLSGTDTAKAATAAGILSGVLGAGGTSTNDYLIIPYRDKTGGTRRNFYVMWGRTTTAATGLGPVTFPVNFPNSVVNIVTSVTKSGGALTVGSGWLTDTLTTSGVTLASQTAQVTPITYIAIGW